MKKIIVLFFIIFSFSFSLKNINSETIFDGKTEVGELYTATFNNVSEKNLKLKRELQYLQQKDNFTFLK